MTPYRGSELDILKGSAMPAEGGTVSPAIWIVALVAILVMAGIAFARRKK